MERKIFKSLFRSGGYFESRIVLVQVVVGASKMNPLQKTTPTEKKTSTGNWWKIFGKKYFRSKIFLTGVVFDRGFISAGIFL